MVYSTFVEVGSKQQIRIVYDGISHYLAALQKGEFINGSSKETLLLDTSGELAHFNKRQEAINKI